MSGEYLTLKSSKGTLVFFPPSNFMNLLQQIRQEKPEDYEKIKLLFGSKNVESNYLFCLKALSTLPSDISLSASINDLVASTILLLYKTLLVPPSYGKGIYYFTTNDSYGFQIGTPFENSKIKLLLFDTSDNVLELNIKTNSDNKLTQNEINNLLKSFRKSS